MDHLHLYLGALVYFAHGCFCLFRTRVLLCILPQSVISSCFFKSAGVVFTRAALFVESLCPRLSKRTRRFQETRSLCSWVFGDLFGVSRTSVGFGGFEFSKPTVLKFFNFLCTFLPREIFIETENAIQTTPNNNATWRASNGIGKKR